MGDLMDKLRVDLTALTRDSLHEVRNELVDLAVEEFTDTSVNTSAAPGSESVSTGEVVLTRGSTLMDLDIVSSGSVPLPAKDGDAKAIGKAVANLIGDISASHPSASLAVNDPSLAGNDAYRPLAVSKGLVFCGVASHADTAPLVAADTVPSDASAPVVRAPCC